MKTMETNDVRQKILKYETFVNDVLKNDLGYVVFELVTKGAILIRLWWCIAFIVLLQKSE